MSLHIKVNKIFGYVKLATLKNTRSISSIAQVLKLIVRKLTRLLISIFVRWVAI